MKNILSICIVASLLLICFGAGPNTEAPKPEGSVINKSNIPIATFSVLTEMPIGSVQGGCYVEDGLYLFCYSSKTSDNLTLVCFDSQKGKIIWKKELNGGAHGNAICFRPADRRLYIADCLSYADTQNLLNTISVVDYDNLDAGVIDVIRLPGGGSVYSIAYDRDTDTFYSTNYRGAVEGYANALYSYEGVFERVKTVVYLDDYAARFKPAHSSQGVQCVHDGIAYIPYHVPSAKIAGFDITSGELVWAASVPYEIREHVVGELESVIFDPENQDLMLLSARAFLRYEDDSGVKDGWIREYDGYWYYYDAGVMQTGWKQIRGLRYYLDESGKMLIGQHIIDGEQYSFNEYGALITDKWEKDGRAWIYYGADGRKAIDVELNIDGSWFRFDSSGIMLANTWYRDEAGTQYYFTTYGCRAHDEELEIQGGWYRFDENGKMLTNAWYHDGPMSCYYEESGKKAVNTGLEIDGEYYRFDSDGVLIQDTWYKENGVLYYYDEDGRRSTEKKGKHPGQMLQP